MTSPDHIFTLEQLEDQLSDLSGEVQRNYDHFRCIRVIAQNPAAPGTDESWHSLGALGAHYTVTLGRYRLTTDNCVELDIQVSGDGLQATSVAFANTLPAAYTPATAHTRLPMGTDRAVTAGDLWPRLNVDAAGGVTVINGGTANIFACCVRVPLD